MKLLDTEILSKLLKITKVDENGKQIEQKIEVDLQAYGDLLDKLYKKVNEQGSELDARE